MIKKYIFLSLFLILAHVSESQTRFELVAGGTLDDLASSVITTSDSGYLVGGATLSFGNYVDALIWKLNAVGNVQWAKTYGNYQFDRVCTAIQAIDGNYVFTGTAIDTLHLDSDAWLFKTDTSGNVLWSKLYGNGGVDYLSSLKSIVQTTDSGFAIIGATDFAGGVSNIDLFIIRTNAIGDTLWTKIFKGFFTDQPSSITQTVDGGFIICGRTNSHGNLIMDVFLLKLSAIGNVEWARRYGHNVWDESTSVIQTSDLGFAVCGSTTSFGAGDYEGLVFKTDSVGNLQWSTVAGNAAGDDALYAIVETNDGGFAAAGFAEGYSVHRSGNPSLMGNDSADVWILKLNAAGDTVWNYLYGGYRLDEGYTIQQHTDGGLLTAAYTQSFTPDNSWQAYVLKTDSMGMACTGVQIFPSVLHPVLSVDTISFIELNDIVVKNYPVTASTVSMADSMFCFEYTFVNGLSNSASVFAYPNPFHNRFEIKTNLIGNHPFEIKIIDVLGKNISGKFLFQKTNDGNIACSLQKNLAPGIYFVTLASNQKLIKTFKLICQ